VPPIEKATRGRERPVRAPESASSDQAEAAPREAEGDRESVSGRSRSKQPLPDSRFRNRWLRPWERDSVVIGHEPTSVSLLLRQAEVEEAGRSRFLCLRCQLTKDGPGLGLGGMMMPSVPPSASQDGPGLGLGGMMMPSLPPSASQDGPGLGLGGMMMPPVLLLSAIHDGAGLGGATLLPPTASISATIASSTATLSRFLMLSSLSDDRAFALGYIRNSTSH